MTTRLFLWPVAVVAGLLPVRRWASFDTVLPMREAAPLAGLVTMLVGLALGLRGFLIYLQAFVERISDQAALDAAATAGAAGLPLGAWVIPAAISFALTPTGATAVYLSLTGLVRAISGYVDDPRGDPLLTLLDSATTRLITGTRATRIRRALEQREGPAVPDRLVTGSWAGLAEVDFVVIAARRKPGWDDGVFVITAEQWFRLGRPYDMPLPQGLRTAYPLTAIRTQEVLRKGVAYDLPPLGTSTRR